MQPTRAQQIEKYPEAQRWLEKDDKERLELVRAAKEGSVWRSLKSGRTATKLKKTDSSDIKLQHESGRIGIVQDHYFAYDFFPVSESTETKEPTREELIAKNPDAKVWFKQTAVQRAEQVESAKPGSNWENIETNEVVTLRYHSPSKDSGDVTQWVAGIVFVGTSPAAQDCQEIEETDFIFNYFPTNKPATIP